MNNQSHISRTSPVLEFHSKEGMFDEIVLLRILQCPNTKAVTLRATMTDDDGVVWESINTFKPIDSIVDLAKQAPIEGSYDSIDDMGFIWSMSPKDLESSVLFSSNEITPIDLELRVDIDGRIIDTINLTRYRVRPDVLRIEVREGGLFGTLFVPRNASNIPGILDIAGSGGGLSEMRAALLASHGYASFALAYFGCESLPEALTDIPLEYFENAIQYLRRQESVDPNKIGIIGGSRGGELSLLLGATYPEIGCVIGYVPSIYRCPGMGGAAWTLNGEPLPFLSSKGDMQIMDEIQEKIATGEAASFTPWFNSVIRDRDSIRVAEIPVENINGPIMLISGQDDQVWPSTELCDYVIQRLEANGFEHEVIHLSYPEAGHLIGPPFKPTTISEATHPVLGIKLELGGTPAANAYACLDSWRHVLDFLEKSFKSGR